MKQYEITIRTPHGCAEIKADSIEEFVNLCPEFFSKAMPEELRNHRLNALYMAYKERFGLDPDNPSPIESFGLEKTLIQCFLSRMTINQAVEYLKQDHNFNTSKSSIGRFWRRFRMLGFKRDSKIVL